MAHFLGYLQGNIQEAIYYSTKKSGLTATLTSHEGRIKIVLWFNSKTKEDWVTIEKDTCLGEGIYEHLYTGPIGRKLPKNENKTVTNS